MQLHIADDFAAIAAAQRALALSCIVVRQNRKHSYYDESKERGDWAALRPR